MRATELHADVLGLKKSEVKVGGSLELRAADMSPDERRKWLEDNRALLEKFFEAQGWKRPDGNPA